MRRAPVALLLAVVGCDSGGLEPTLGEPAAIAIEAPDSVLAVGDELALSAVVRDEHGRALTDAEVVWHTGDSATVAVDGAGVVEPLAIGYARVIASHAALQDTLLLRVHDGAVPDDRVRLRVADGAAATELSAFLRFDDTMADGPGDMAGLAAYTLGLARDTVLNVLFPGAPPVGRVSLTPWPLAGEDFAGPIALLRFGRAEQGDVEYFVSVDAGWLELDVEDPPAPGWRRGSAAGFLHLPLVRIVPDPGGGAPVLTDDTVIVHANVNVGYQQVLHGHAVVTLENAPVEGTSRLSRTLIPGEDGHGGWFYSWDADFDGTGSQDSPWELNQELRMLDPGTGSFALPRFTGEAFGRPELWPPVFSSIFFRDDPRLALVVDGTLTVEAYVAPTLEDFGHITGVIDARFELWSDPETPTGDTLHAHTVFAVPIAPEVGPPPVAGLARPGTL